MSLKEKNTLHLNLLLNLVKLNIKRSEKYKESQKGKLY